MHEQDVPTASNPKPILTVRDLKKHFPVRGGLFSQKRFVHAVDGVDFSVMPGKTLGLVGESGSGKTTVGRTLLRLIEPTEGQVNFQGQDVFSMKGRKLRRLRKKMTIIFQDPAGSLNPRMTVGSIVAEPLKVHMRMSGRQRQMRVRELLDRVGLSGAYVNRYPHEFSGGQRQRIGIARALASEPDFIVCDEPVSALDVSIQAQILNLLADLQQELGLAYLFIAHNLSVVEHFADTVAVMYLGRIAEIAPRDELYRNPQHPYTQSLLSSVPVADPGIRKERVILPGEIPSPIDPPTGCSFHPRCPLTRERAMGLPDRETHTILSQGEAVRIVKRCAFERPELQATGGNTDHCHACLLRQGPPSPPQTD
ncbi:MAG: ABC transporter ATP-binding protein [Phycisphaerae bacterium]